MTFKDILTKFHQELGVSYVTVSKWCSNTTQPTLATLDQKARILGVNAKDLINDTDHNQYSKNG